MIEENDWRLSMGQGEGMKDREFQYKEFVKPSESWDHEHCVFCFHTFMENPQGQKDCSKQGYCSTDGRQDWVCDECFNDFKEMFHLTLTGKSYLESKIRMNLVKNIIDNWDPIDLFPGAPDDEYRTEIEAIEQLYRFTDNPTKLSEGIYEVFVKSFGEDTFKKSKSECEQIAQMILSQKET